MAFSAGKSAIFQMDNASASLTDYSTYITSVTISFMSDTGEVHTLGDQSKEYLATLKDFTVSLEGIFDPTFDVAMNSALGTSTTKSIQYDPQGSGSGNVRYSGETIGTAYDINSPVGDVLTWTATLQGTGGITRSTI